MAPRMALAMAGAGIAAAIGGCGSSIHATAVPSHVRSTQAVHTSEVRATQAELRIGGPAPVAPTSRAQSFVGVASELSTIPSLAGTPSDPDTPFIGLLKNLAGGAPFSLRLGGHSSDLSWWAIPGVKKPAPISYTLTPAWAADVRALLTAVGGRALVGVNLEDDSARLAAYEISQYDKYVGTQYIRAFEVGNEPELYPVFPYYRGSDGKLVFGRPKNGYDIPAFGRDFTRLAAGLGSAPIAGPGVGSVKWLQSLGEILSDLPSRLKVITVHAYPLVKCSASTHHPVTAFFEPSSIGGLAAAIHGMVIAANAHHHPLRVAEINGVSCGGEAGLSDAFAEALWALNMLPALWQAGVEGVNFQTINGDLNQVFKASNTASGWRVSVQPVYYGLLAFAQSAPAGSRLLTVSGPASGTGGLFRWAVRQPNGHERIVLTNINGTATKVGVSASGVSGSATVSLLSAASLGATSGVALDGQTLSPSTGALTGRQTQTTLRPGTGGIYTVPVPAHSAAIVDLGS